MRAARPGVSLATRDRACDVMAMLSRRDRRENILMLDEEEEDEPVMIGGSRFKPACLYLQQQQQHEEVEVTTINGMCSGRGSSKRSTG